MPVPVGEAEQNRTVRRVCGTLTDCEAISLRVIAVNFRASLRARRLARNFSRATGISIARFLQPDDFEGKHFP